MDTFSISYKAYRKKYQTDLTDTQRQVINKCVEYKARKRKYSLQSVGNAIMYVVKTGCQWRMLPKDYPKWVLVYYYYRKWVEAEMFDKILDKLRSKVRVKQGQNMHATLGIMDSQTVRWGNNRSLKSYDGNKKVKGIKRHIVVDKNGFLLAVMVTVVHIRDSQAVILLMRVLQNAFCSIKFFLADGGYRGDVISEVFKKFGYMLQIVLRKTEDKTGFKAISKRWVVGRTFSRFDNDRRLCHNYNF